MSRESAAQFLRELGKDLNLMDEVKAVDKNGLLNVAKIRGYDCTLDELRIVAAEITQKAADGSETLSEEELEMVTGGVNTFGTFGGDEAYQAKNVTSGINEHLAAKSGVWSRKGAGRDGNVR